MGSSIYRSTFIVQLKDTQNSTWQGNVVWAEKNISKPFRSALELIKLIDSAVTEPDVQDNEQEKANVTIAG